MFTLFAVWLAAQTTTLPAGLTFTVYPLETLHAGAQEADEPLLFVLAQDVVLFPGQAPVLSRHALLSGHVVRSRVAGRFVGKAELEVALEQLVLPEGAMVPITARIVSIGGQFVRGNTIVGKGHATSDAVFLLFPPTTIYKVLRLPSRGPALRLEPEQALTVKLLAPLTIAGHNDIPATKPDRPSQSLLQLPRELRPEHQALLERAGHEWLEYVARNVDRIEYYDAALVPTADGSKAIGLAQAVRRERIAKIATGGSLTSAQISGIIVHEAAHLEGIKSTGHYFDQEYAEAKAAQFQRDLRRRNAR